jgi:superfamily II DNA or RNA helicase
MPNGGFYHSSRGLYPFQAEAVAHMLVYGRLIAVADVGLGKTHIAMCTAAKLFQRGEIDLVMMVGRRNKIVDRNEFAADWEEFTSFSSTVYHGTGRQARLGKTGVPQVFLTTYETGKTELMKMMPAPKRSKGVKTPGSLMDALDLQGKRILWIFDEITRFGNRSSDLYRTYEWVLNTLRKQAPQYVLGLTATPFMDDYEQAFNIGRLVAPAEMPSIGAFTETYARGRDDRNKMVFREEMREQFASLFQTIIYRKRGSDPDVISQMPRLLPDFWPVSLDPLQRKFYDRIAEIYFDEDNEDYAELEDEQKSHLATVLKLVSGHPAALLHADDPLATEIVAAVGEKGIRAIPSGKTLALIERLEPLIRGQGSQVLLFSFYADTVIPEVTADLRSAGYTVGLYTGAQSDSQNRESKQAFKSGQLQILFSSDAGSEGLNLPEADYIIEYETAKTWATRAQRFGRGTRLTSTSPVVHGITMLAQDTREVGMLAKVFRRKNNQDILLGDLGAQGHITAAELRTMLNASYEETS